MVSSVDIAVFEALNGASGRSFTIDALFALAMDSPVIKGGPIAACFVFAWWQGGPGDARDRRRSILILTLVTLFLLAPVMKAVSTGMPVSPRPILQAEQLHVLQDERLLAAPRTRYTPPATGLAAQIAADARAGTVAPNDLASFPSDHAALFAAFALGIFLAHRGAGIVALAWFALGVSLPRVASGLHWPSDMIAGALAGAAMLALVLLAGRALRPAIDTHLLPLGDRHPGWMQAILFLLLVEAASAMATLQRVVELGSGAMAR